MKNSFRHFFVFFMAAAFMFVACEKDNQTTDPDPIDPSETLNPIYPDCGEGNHELVHMEAIAPTASKAGNIRHWHCEKCGKNFLDEKGILEMTTPPFLRALNHNLGHSNVMDFKRGSFPWSSMAKSNTGTKAVSPIDAVKSGVSIISGVCSIACSIQKLINGSEEDHTEEYFNQIMEGLDGISGAVSDVNSRTQKILGLLKEAPYQNYIDKTNNEIQAIWEPTTTTYSGIKFFMNLYNEGKISESDFNEQVVFLLKDWVQKAYSGEDMPTLVTRRLREFSSVTVDGTTQTFPQISKKHCNSYTSFDHQAYDDRAGLNRYNEFVLSAAYYIDQLARTCDAIKYNSQYFHYSDSVKFRGYLENMIAIVKQDSINMDNAYSKYRVFHNCSDETEIYLKNKAIAPVDFYGWLIDNKKNCWFPGDNYDGKLVTNFDRMWKECTGLSKNNNITEEDFKAIYNEFNPYNNSNHVSLYSVVRDTATISNVRKFEESVSTKNGSAKNYLMFWREKKEINSGDKEKYDKSKFYTHPSYDYYNTFFFHNPGWNSSNEGNTSWFAVETALDDSANRIETFWTKYSYIETAWYTDSSYEETNKKEYGIYKGEGAKTNPSVIFTLLEKYTETIYD